MSQNQADMLHVFLRLWENQNIVKVNVPEHIIDKCLEQRRGIRAQMLF